MTLQKKVAKSVHIFKGVQAGTPQQRAPAKKCQNYNAI